MPHCLQDMDLVDGVFSLLAVHLRHIDDLHYVGLSIGNRLYQHSETERALSDDFKLSIFFHLFFEI